MEKILIVRLGAMGDVIHALPAVRALRQSLPNATIGWAIEEKWVELLCAKGTSCDGPLSPQKPLVDKIHLLNTRRWRSKIFAPQTWSEAAQLRRELRSERYDLAIDLQGAVKSAVVTRLSGASCRFGSESPREGVATRFYSKTVRTPQLHVIDQAKEIVRTAAAHSYAYGDWKPDLGSNAGDAFPQEPKAEAWCDVELRKRSLNNAKFVLLNPGAGWGAKQWPAERYGEVARALENDGIRAVVNIGPTPAEKQLGDAVKKSSNGSARAVTCSIGELIALVRRASLFIGGDTGPMHLAAILGVPVVALFGPTNPQRNGPYYSPHVVLRSQRSVESYSHHHQSDAGLMSIGVEEVTAAARKLLG